jgi:hypothetical protein
MSNSNKDLDKLSSKYRGIVHKEVTKDEIEALKERCFNNAKIAAKKKEDSSSKKNTKTQVGKGISKYDSNNQRYNPDYYFEEKN